MKPGRELDALVAEKVMGWTLPQHSPFLLWQGRNCVVEFRPSTDIAAAWEVVEKMSDGFRFDLHKVGGMSLWNTRFTENKVFNALTSTYDSTLAPHAICLAALKAVGAL